VSLPRKRTFQFADPAPAVGAGVHESTRYTRGWRGQIEKRLGSIRGRGRIEYRHTRKAILFALCERRCLNHFSPPWKKLAFESAAKSATSNVPRRK
jgi:hypothetical protein